MGHGKVEIKSRSYKGRKTHKASIKGGNGEPILITPPKQAYFNSEDLENALYKSYLVLKDRFKDREA